MALRRSLDNNMPLLCSSATSPREF